MTKHRPKSVSRGRAGFSLLDLAVVVAIIGVLAAFGVPRFIKSVERSRAAEAYEYLASVRSAQERHQARFGTYAEDIADLAIKASPPLYFTVPATFSPSAGGRSLQDSWTLTLTRAGTSTGYGAYTVVFTEAGFDAEASTIADDPADADISPIRP